MFGLSDELENEMQNILAQSEIGALFNNAKDHLSDWYYSYVIAMHIMAQEAND